MIWHNNWVWHNLDERSTNKNVDFKFGLTPYSFKITSFKEACYSTAKTIYDKHKKVYVALSGGMDSLYVTKVFHEMKIPFVPVIISSEANTEETKYAFDYCIDQNIPHHVITTTGKHLLEYYYKEIYPKTYSIGINGSASVIAAQYAKENGGIILCGEYLMDVEHDNITCSDYDFYRDIMVGENINFFYYTPQIAYAMAKESEVPFEHTKYKLYQFETNREKIKYQYSRPISNVVKNFNVFLSNQKCEYTLMSRPDFLTMMEQYAI